jgi:putative membrane protein
MATITGFPEFGEVFGLAVVLVAVYLVIYAYTTAHDEIALIRANVLSAAIALGMSLIGFALPLSSAIIHSSDLPSFLLWGAVAMFVQMVAYWLVRLILPDLPRRIAAGEVTAALFLGCVSLAAGMISAAAMSI